MSFVPARARWYAIARPMMPAPMITISARSRMERILLQRPLFCGAGVHERFEELRSGRDQRPVAEVHLPARVVGGTAERVAVAGACRGGDRLRRARVPELARIA